MEFRNWLNENDQTTVINKVKVQVERFSSEAAINQEIAKYRARDLNDLIRILSRDTKVRRVLQAYQQAKNQQQESWLGSTFNTMIGFAKNIFTTVSRSILKVFMPGMTMPKAPLMAKITYAGMLLLAASVSGIVLASGSVGVVAAPWGLLWFGHNFIEPVVRHGSQGISGGY